MGVEAVYKFEYLDQVLRTSKKGRLAYMVDSSKAIDRMYGDLHCHRRLVSRRGRPGP